MPQQTPQDETNADDVAQNKQPTNLTAGTGHIQWMSICPSSASLTDKFLDFNLRQLASLVVRQNEFLEALLERLDKPE